MYTVFSSNTCRHLVHGKLSLDAEKVEVTLLLGCMPSSLEESLRLLVENAQVTGDARDTISRVLAPSSFWWKNTCVTFMLSDEEISHEFTVCSALLVTSYV